eukprot:gene3019-3703_t
MKDIADVGAIDAFEEYNIASDLYVDTMAMKEAVRRYKFSIVIDGNCDSWRLQELLGSNVVVLKTVSPEQQWFSSMLQPYVHYIPITVTPFEVPTSEFERARRTNTSLRQSSDVVQQIQWAIRNPEFCGRILENANLFYQRYLSDEAM